MSTYSYVLEPAEPARLGLVVLQTDEQLERDFRTLLPAGVTPYVSRVPSGAEVSSDTLQSMAGHLTRAAALLPDARQFDVIGYGCTSGTAQIGTGEIARLVGQGAPTRAVTEPVSALVAACRYLGLKRLAFLSPYVESVSDKLRDALAEADLSTPVFGSFAEAQEARVARITPASIVEAATDLLDGAEVDGLFLSCTNLRGVEAGPAITRATGLPVLSSNLVLAWHMCRLAGVGTDMLDLQRAA